MDRPKFKVNFGTDKKPKWVKERVYFGWGTYDSTYTLNQEKCTSHHAYKNTAQFNSCQEAKKVAEQLMSKEEEKEKKAKKEKLEDVWTECKC